MTIADDYDERTLIEAAQADPARFVDLYDRHFQRVYGYVIRRTGSRAEAEDITSAVFERALTNLRRFEWRGVPFVAWLYRIAANAIADRRKQTERDSPDPPPDMPDDRESEEIERRALIADLIERLPDTQRQVIEMRFAEEKSIREIAAALDRSEGAVKQLQLRALENLRKHMEGRHG
ncbi:MAG TPA: sigma-70 family RNA polymerase sigma factor [Vicinamibacterales bacterium]|nr:sigma-70 family RNA polymerase sigma factor [Vicinamibacterales bacterium]